MVQLNSRYKKNNDKIMIEKIDKKDNKDKKNNDSLPIISNI